MDLSWDEVGDRRRRLPEAIAATADFINRHPDRVLFGTDEVPPASRPFDAARVKVRAWEKADSK